MLQVETLTGSGPRPGTVYDAISRLERRSWIEAMASDDRRRPYRLTTAGRAVPHARLDTLRALTKAADHVSR